MASLTTSLTISSSDLSEQESLAVSLSKALSAVGTVTQFQKVTDTTKRVLLAQAAYGKSYVLLHNLDGSIIQYIGMDTEADDLVNDDLTDVIFAIGGGEYAFFPWHAAYDLHVKAASGTPTLEIRVFEVDD